MTHDELLAKLWILPTDITELQHGAKAVHALRAVVELHKPRNTSMGIVCCELCSERIFKAYPCPTIQAIEKTLQ